MTPIEQAIKDIEKLSTPALAGKEGDEETCDNCGEDLSLETYDWFDKGYELALEDVKSILKKLL